MAASMGTTMIVPVSRMPTAIALPGPGHFGPAGAQGCIIFDAGEDCRRRDVLARFFGEELDALLWVEDYLQDRDLLNVLANLEEKMPGEDEDDHDAEMYDKKALVSDGSYGDASGSSDIGS